MLKFLLGKQKSINGKKLITNLKLQKYMHLFMLLTIAYVIVFAYLPMFGIMMAFREYKVSTGIAGFFTCKWVGLKYFKEFIQDPSFWVIMKNTIVLSLLKTVFTFPMPILLAIILDETRNKAIKKVVQTASYLPHFISWVVVSGIIFSFFNQQDGLINEILLKLGVIENPIPLITNPRYFLLLAVISDIWKTTGWWTIIFMASIASIDAGVYEAAVMDGAGRIRKIWNITLPNMKGAISTVLILSISGLLGGGLGGSNFEQAYLLGNPLNYSVSNILQTHVLNMGLNVGRYSYASAIGIFASAFSFLMLLFSNTVVKRTTGNGIV